MLTIAQSKESVTWWDKQTLVETGQGLVLEHSPGAKHGVVKLKALSLIPNERAEE